MRRGVWAAAPAAGSRPPGGGAGLRAVVLACVAGGVIAALSWAIGYATGSPKLISRGKWGLVGSVVAAMAAAGLSPLYGWVISTFS